jgi:hypothetical protein
VLQQVTLPLVPLSILSVLEHLQIAPAVDSVLDVDVVEEEDAEVLFLVVVFLTSVLRVALGGGTNALAVAIPVLR